MTLTLALDLLLLLGFTLRLTRLVVSDTLFEWVKSSLDTWALDHPNRERFVSGFDCPWCASYQLAVLTIASLLVAYTVGGSLLLAWRLVAGAFSLSWVTVQIGSRAGDYDD